MALRSTITGKMIKEGSTAFRKDALFLLAVAAHWYLTKPPAGFCALGAKSILDHEPDGSKYVLWLSDHVPGIRKIARKIGVFEAVSLDPTRLRAVDESLEEFLGTIAPYPATSSNWDVKKGTREEFLCVRYVIFRLVTNSDKTKVINELARELGGLRAAIVFGAACCGSFAAVFSVMSESVLSESPIRPPGAAAGGGCLADIKTGGEPAKRDDGDAKWFRVLQVLAESTRSYLHVVLEKEARDNRKELVRFLKMIVPLKSPQANSYAAQLIAAFGSVYFKGIDDDDDVLHLLDSIFQSQGCAIIHRRAAAWAIGDILHTNCFKDCRKYSSKIDEWLSPKSEFAIDEELMRALRRAQTEVPFSFW